MGKICPTCEHEELSTAEVVAEMRSHQNIMDAHKYEAERDAAIKRAEESERQLAAVMEMRERDAPLWDRLGGVAKTLLSTDATKLADQRDRALALLRDTACVQATDCCANAEEDVPLASDDPLYLECADESPCWEHRRRWLLAEVEANDAK